MEKTLLLPSNEEQKARKVANSSRRLKAFKTYAILTLFALALFHFALPTHKCSHKNLLSTTSSSAKNTKAFYVDFLKQSNLAANWSEAYTNASHLAGSNPDLVQYQKQKFIDFGLTNVEVEDYDIYLNYPINNSLTLFGNNSVLFKPTLTEDAIPEDPTTNGDDLVPAFHGYSASGNVTAEYIYANYGTLEDFEYLENKGVNVSGKIVIVRYGKLFRGLKVKFAQKYGAIGVLIYSDPADDGEVVESNGYAAYPDGPARNPSSLQRGSVQFLSQIPGDPTTPGWPSKKSDDDSEDDDIKRVDPYNSIPKIPSLPISYKEVYPILKSLNGKGPAFDHFKGSLKHVNYNVGPNPGFTLELVNNQDYKIRKIYNVYGEIKGINEDQVVLIGNHRDAWIKGGAGDPNSGSAVMLEMLRTLQYLQKTFDWKPLRTIRFASWDGEEYALLGSTEFGEYHHDLLQENLVAYLNLDDAVSGSQLNLEASPLLNQIILENAKLVQYSLNQTLFDHYYESDPNKKIGMLGSGSDFTVFMEHLGITSMNAAFGPGKTDAVYHYHSNYDSFYWMSKFGDPGFKLHNVMAQYFGLIILDIADARKINFGVLENSLEFIGHLSDELELLTKKPDYYSHYYNKHVNLSMTYDYEDDEYLELQNILLKKFPRSILDDKQAFKLKCCGKSNSTISFQSLLDQVFSSTGKMIKQSKKFDREISETLAKLEDVEKKLETARNPWLILKLRIKRRIYISVLSSLNKKLQFIERLFLIYKGLDGRSWFRHFIYAVDRNNGYSAVAMPGLKEAIEDNDAERIIEALFLLNGIARKVAFFLKH